MKRNGGAETTDFAEGDKVRDLAQLRGTVIGFSVRKVQVEWDDGFRGYIEPRYLTRRASGDNVP